MKYRKHFINGFYSTILLILLNGCSVSIHSVKSNSDNTTYTKPRLAISYGEYTKSFNKKVKYNIQEIANFHKQDINLEIFYIQQNSLVLNENVNDRNIEYIITKAEQVSNDVIFFMVATHVDLQNFSIRNISYQITGYDLTLKKEVWKANLKGNNGASPKMIANELYDKLIIDGLLN